MGLKKFQSYVTESIGVSESSLILIDFIANRVYQDFLDFYKSKKRFHSEVDEISWPTIKDNLSRTDMIKWKEFPVSSIRLRTKFKTNESFRDGSAFSTSGNFDHFSTRANSKKYSSIVDPKGKSELTTLKISIDVNVFLSTVFKKDDLKDLQRDIRATVSHELNHGFEYFKRQGIEKFIKGGTFIDKRPDQYLGTAGISLKNPDPTLINSKLFDRWEEFTYLLYYSDPTEVNAMTQESLEYVKNSNGDPKKIPSWKWAIKMENFSSEETKNELLSLAMGDEFKLEFLKESFIDKLKKVIRNHEGGRLKTQNDLVKLDLMNCTQMIKHYEHQIVSSGERLKKNIIRLFSYNQKS